VRRRPLLRFSLLLIAFELASAHFGMPFDPRLDIGGYTGCNPVPVEMRARIEGDVIKVMRQSILIEGEVDASIAPAVDTRIILRLRDSVRVQMGERVVAFARVHRPSSQSLPFVFNEAAFCAANHAVFIGETDATRFRIIQRAPLAQQCMATLRGVVAAKIDSLFEQDVASIVQALVLGVDDRIDRSTRSAYASAGTAHALSVSGMHVNIVGAVLFLLCGGKPRRWHTIVLCCMCMTLYVVLTGAEPPAVRAGIMCCAALIGTSRERQVDGLNLLGAAIFIQLLFDPNLMFEVGFILSTCATFSILAFVPMLQSMIRSCMLRPKKWKGALATMLSVNLSASAGTAVPVAIVFGQVAVWSVVANLIVVPILSVALIGSLFVVASDVVLPSLSQPIVWCVSSAIRLSTMLTEFFASITPNTTPAAAVVASVAVLCGTLWFIRSHSWFSLATRSLITATFMWCVLIIPTRPSSEFTILPRTHGIEFLLRSGDELHHVSMYQKYGAVFVRSSHGNTASGFSHSRGD